MFVRHILVFQPVRSYIRMSPCSAFVWKNWPGVLGYRGPGMEMVRTTDLEVRAHGKPRDRTLQSNACRGHVKPLRLHERCDQRGSASAHILECIGVLGLGLVTWRQRRA